MRPWAYFTDAEKGPELHRAKQGETVDKQLVVNVKAMFAVILTQELKNHVFSHKIDSRNDQRDSAPC